MNNERRANCDSLVDIIALVLGFNVLIIKILFKIETLENK